MANGLLLNLLVDRAELNISVRDLVTFIIGNNDGMAPDKSKEYKLIEAIPSEGLTESVLCLKILNIIYPLDAAEFPPSADIYGLIAGNNMDTIWQWINGPDFKADLLDQRGYSLLYHVVNQNPRAEDYKALFQLLVDNGVGLAYERDPGYIIIAGKLKIRETAMESAALEGNYVIVRILVNAGIDFTSKHMASVPESSKQAFQELAAQASAKQAELEQVQQESMAQISLKCMMPEYAANNSDWQIIINALFLAQMQQIGSDKCGTLVTCDNQTVRKDDKLRRVLPSLSLLNIGEIYRVDELMEQYKQKFLIYTPLLDKDIEALRNKAGISQIDLIAPFRYNLTQWGILHICLIEQVGKITGKVRILNSLGGIEFSDIAYAQCIKKIIAQKYEIDLNITEVENKPLLNAITTPKPINYTVIAKILVDMLDMEQDLDLIAENLCAFKYRITEQQRREFVAKLQEQVDCSTSSTSQQEPQLLSMVNNPFAITYLLTSVNKGIIDKGNFYNNIVESIGDSRMIREYNDFMAWYRSLGNDTVNRESLIAKLNQTLINYRPELQKAVALPEGIKLVWERKIDNQYFNYLLKALCICGYKAEDMTSIIEAYQLRDSDHMCSYLEWPYNTKMIKSIEVNRLLGGGKPDQINQPDAGGLYPIHYAAIFGDIKLFKQLHEAGARLDTGLAKGILPIHLAALNDNVGIVGYCLNKDPALLYKSDDNGLNNAHYACSSYYKSISPDLKVVKFLILKYRQEAMTAFSQKSQLSGKTALGMGFYTDNTVNNIKNVVLVILLLDRVKYSLSATNLLDLVIGNYASASIDSHIAVMAPSGQQSAESIFLAIAKIRNNANLSESEQALELMKLCYIPREYPHGLDEEEVSKNIGDYAAKGEFEIVWRWLQSDKFQANWQNKQGDTLVTHMLSHGGQNKNYLRLIQLLIDSGCQIDPDLTKGARKKSKSCKTAMQIAASNGDREVVNILINSGKEFKTENVDLVPKDKEVKFKDLIEQIDEHVQKMQAELLATEANSNSNAVSKDKKLKKKKGGKLGNATKLGNGFLDPEGKDLLIQEAQEQHLDAEATILREQSPVRMRSMVVSRHVGICSLKNHLATDREIVEYNNLVKNIDLDPVVRERGGFGEPELFLKLLESDDDSEIDSYFANVKKVRALQNTEQTYGR